MKVNLNIEEDELFREGMKHLMEGQVRHLLREELGGIVAGEIAKLRILQPQNKALSELVEAEVKRNLPRHADSASLRKLVSDEVHAVVARELQPHIASIKETILQVLGTHLK